MTNETLLEHIEQTRAELHAVTDLTPGDRDLVGNLVTDVIAHLTEQEASEQEALKEHRTKLAIRLEQQVTHLEITHPKLATMLGRIANMLSSLGI